MTAEFFLDANQRKRDNLPSKFWEKKLNQKSAVYMSLSSSRSTQSLLQQKNQSYRNG